MTLNFITLVNKYQVKKKKGIINYKIALLLDSHAQCLPIVILSQSTILGKLCILSGIKSSLLFMYFSLMNLHGHQDHYKVILVFKWIIRQL